MKKIEIFLETLIFNSRWIMAPFYLGLCIALLALLYVFFQELMHLFSPETLTSESSVIVLVLTLIDLSFAGNLLIMVIFSGYENFVSKIDTHDNEDRPDWMGTVDFSGLKLKLISSIVAISGIQLLKVFFSLKDGTTDSENLKWYIIVHLVFVGSGLLLALMDYLVGKTPKH